MLENNLIKANEDIVTISTIAKRMGWGAVSEQSFQRILYLVQILYSFKYAGENIFFYYHFTVTTFGPYSDLIERSLVFLKSSFNLREEEGGLVLSSKKEIPLNQQKVEWLKTVMYMLGKYGEKRLFGFIIINVIASVEFLNVFFVLRTRLNNCVIYIKQSILHV